MNKLETQVLSLIGENPDSPDVFDESNLEPIRDSINEAIQEIVMLQGGYTETFNIPLIADKTFYRLTFKKGFLGWVKDAWLVTQKRRLGQTSLHKLNNTDPRWMIHRNTPTHYFPVGLDIIGFYGKPSSSSDVVEMTCIVIPDHYKTDRDRIKVRDTFQWAIVNYAVSEYWASRGDANEAARHMATYLDNMGIKSAFLSSIGKERQFDRKSEILK